ncbi:MAG TPA: hypothetical protein VF084_12520 [Nitrososphaeraceae archaeon]
MVINNYSVEFSFPFTSIEDEYLYDDCNISSNSIQFFFLKTKEKLYHLSISYVNIVESILFESLMSLSSLSLGELSNPTKLEVRSFNIL